MRKKTQLFKCCLTALAAVTALICVLACSNFFFLNGGITAEAADLTDEAFPKLHWKLEFGDSKIGTIQSVCVTPNYIVTIDNVADDPNQHDIVSAYYKNKTDENGNPVEQYSLAKRVSDFNWEHGNCMAYNPTTNLIYVALYTNTTGDNAGCIYEMDPNTLEYVGKVQIGDGSYNILGIGYKADTNQYVIQTDDGADYSMMLLDANFQIIDNYGPVDPKPGWNFQGLVVNGDYVINLPLTSQKSGEWIDVFSLSRRALVYSARMHIDLHGAAGTEGEGFSMLDTNTLLLIMNVREKSGADMVRFYTARIPEQKSVSENSVSDNSVSGNEVVSENEASVSSASASQNKIQNNKKNHSKGSGKTSKAGSSGKQKAGPKTISSLNQNAVYKKDGSSKPVAEAPAFQFVNSVFVGAGKVIGAVMTGNRKALGKFGRSASRFFRTFWHRIRTFRAPHWLPYAIVFGILLLLGPGMLLYMIHLKKARERLKKRTKELRDEIRKKMDEDD